VLTATPASDGAPIIGADEIASMRPTAVLINVARGSLVDEAALVHALESKRIAGAGLDVYAHEPLAASSPLNRLPNVILTPHMAGQTRLRLFEEVSELLGNVATALRGGTPLHRVGAAPA
jgi:D-3-phosphoglycerate dehydrogenase / 2-oxoglutarate reductase